MGKVSFFPKLALSNLSRNRQFYLPYLLTIMGTTAAYYIAAALAGTGDLPLMTRYAYLSMFMQIGTVVIALFAIIFLTYTNSFLMKRRKRELGLYNILGLDKRNLAVVLGFESLYTAAAGIVGGLLLGMLFQKLVTLLLYKIMRADAFFGFYVSVPGILSTVVLFGLILLGNLLVNLGRIRVQNPMDMLRESSAGEREPKTRFLTAILGVLALGGGYWIAVTTRSAMEAVGLYFVAVFLVIIGTYCLFSAVSIVVLKALRKNKKFYYQTNHFIGVSGMLYRMKRNAVGLANICILSTMVLVMVSGTLSLYLGTERAMADQFPGNVSVDVKYDPMEPDALQEEELILRLEAAMAREGLTPTPVYSYSWLKLSADQTDGGYAIQDSGAYSCQLCLISAEHYARISDTALGTPQELTLTFPDGSAVTVTGTRLSDELPAIGGAFASTATPHWFVVSDQESLSQISAAEGGYMDWYGFWNVDGTEAQQRDLPYLVESNADLTGTGSWARLDIQTKASFGGEYYSINGGFLFLGMFLGLLFIMAAVLIIYYKQVSEGYEDRERYQIMQKVGMERRTVRRSVNSQILVVFFAPLALTAVHIAFNYGLMVQLLTLFSLYRPATVLWCTLGTFAAFCLIYALVYWATARTYYRIVQR